MLLLHIYIEFVYSNGQLKHTFIYIERIWEYEGVKL